MSRTADKQAQKQGQRRLQRQVEQARLQTARRHAIKRRATRLGGGIVAALALASAIAYALHANGSTATTAAAATLGAPSNAVPPSPAGQFTRAGSVIRRGGKVEVLFVGALFCPHCAVERWAVVKALSQFGTFSNARSTTNGQGVPTFDLTHAGYRSNYVSFVHRDLKDQNYNNLETLSPDESSLFSRYDSSGSIPMVLLGGYAMSGSPIDPGEVQDKPFKAVQSGLQHGVNQSFVRDINAEANVLTALVCHADGMRPVAVCNRSVIRHLVSSLK